jgi:excinuclease ABC subunit B
MYADKETAAMRTAIEETNRRREIQLAYNREHGITPETVKKGISDITDFLALESQVPRSKRRRASRDEDIRTPEELERLIVEVEEEMFAAAEDLRFEYAAKLRDEIKDLRHELDRVAGAPRQASS